MIRLLGWIIVAIMAVLSGVCIMWAYQFMSFAGDDGCDQAPEHKEQEAIGRSVAAQFETGSGRIEFVKSAEFIDFQCRSICSDGSYGDECVPKLGEVTTEHCIYTIETGLCSHSVLLRGRYLDDTLHGRLRVFVSSWD